MLACNQNLQSTIHQLLQLGADEVVDDVWQDRISGYYTMLAMVLNTARTPVPPGHTPALRAFPR